MKRKWILQATMLIAAFLFSAGAAVAQKIPVILDTDIGDDIDDSWALTILLKSPRYDVNLVTTTFGKSEYRAKLIAKFLTVAGRPDVPIGLGAGGRQGTGNQQGWVESYQLGEYRGTVHEDGVKALVDCVNVHAANNQTVIIFAIGPLDTLGEALRRDPSIAQKAAIAGMLGAVRKGYDGKPQVEPEWNVKSNIAAARAVLGAPWKRSIITPLDTCGLVRLRGARFQAIRETGDVLIRALVENYRMWAGKNDVSELAESSVLFDTVAIYLAGPTPETLLKIETLPILVDDRGITKIDPAGTKMYVATEWKDLDGYYDLLVNILTAR